MKNPTQDRLPHLDPDKLPRGYFYIFFLILLYWIYLVITTSPVIVYDAIGYVDSGRLLMQKGWVQFFSSGLNREPLFPLIIFWSMKLEQATGLAYHYFCKIILLFFYALAIAGVYRLIRKMGGRSSSAAWGAIYLGISPALLNSCLWLWSEAASYPWVIGIILSSIKLWQSIKDCQKTKDVLLSSVYLSSMFFMLTMAKSMAAMVFVIFIWPMAGGCIYYAFKKDFVRLGRIVLALLMTAGLFFITIEEYKNLNFRFNGRYAITFQDSAVLFGNTIRRLKPLNVDRILQAVLSVPRLGFCQEFYHGECIFWGCQYSDQIASNTSSQLEKLGCNYQKKQAFFMEESLRWIKQHPIQEFFMSCLEASKMFFWETKLFFVNYPAWLHKIHCIPFIVLGLSFTWALLSIIGLIFGLKQAWKLRQSQAGAAFVLTTSFILCFMGLYSFFFIDLRYALSIAPLFVALAFVWLEQIRE